MERARRITERVLPRLEEIYKSQKKNMDVEDLTTGFDNRMYGMHEIVEDKKITFMKQKVITIKCNNAREYFFAAPASPVWPKPYAKSEDQNRQLRQIDF